MTDNVTQLKTVEPEQTIAKPNEGVQALVEMVNPQAIAACEYLASSELVPKDYRGKPENVLVAVQWGSELGLQPMQALQNISVINGRPAIWGDAMLAIIQTNPDFISITETLDGKAGEEVAICTVFRRNAEPVERTFSMADAKTAGLTEKQGTWKQYPKRMLQQRARGFALRDSFADALKGMKTAEEVRDEIDVTPPSGRPTQGGSDGVVDSLKGKDPIEGEAEKVKLEPIQDWIDTAKIAPNEQELKNLYRQARERGHTAADLKKLSAASSKRKKQLAELNQPDLPAVPEHLVNSLADWEAEMQEHGFEVVEAAINGADIPDEDKAILTTVLGNKS